MQLTDEQKRMYEGECGPGVQKAMRFLLEYGEAFDSQRMAKVDSVHIIALDPYRWMSSLLEGVEEVRVLSTLHSLQPPGTKWDRKMGLTEEGSERVLDAQKRRLELYDKVGCFSLFTCAPYLAGNVVSKGAVFSWAGSSGIVINNSLFGARGNRDSGVAMLCSAITGLTPEMLRLTSEGRYGEFLFRLEGLDVESFTEADYGALGYYIGEIAGTRNVVIEGIPPHVPFEKLKYLLSPLPVSGGVSMCHIVGVTPEAPNVEEALGHRKPRQEIAVGPRELQQAWEKLHTAERDEVDVVCIGCPHCTMREVREIAGLLSGKKKAERVRLWVSTNEAVYAVAKRMGLVDAIEEAGGLVVTDLCIMAFPFGSMDVPATTVASNSARAAHYHSRGVGGSGVGTLYGSVEHCIDAAITGRWGG